MCPASGPMPGAVACRTPAGTVPIDCDRTDLPNDAARIDPARTVRPAWSPTVAAVRARSAVKSLAARALPVDEMVSEPDMLAPLTGRGP